MMLEVDEVRDGNIQADGHNAYRYTEKMESIEKKWLNLTGYFLLRRCNFLHCVST
jgi:hypothetical protein